MQGDTTRDEAAALRRALGEPARRREAGDEPARFAGGGRAGRGGGFAEGGWGRRLHPPTEREDPGAADDSSGVRGAGSAGAASA